MNVDLLREAFGHAEFGIRDASAVLGTSIATTRTLLKEMRTKGLIVRVGRGRYKVAQNPTNLALERLQARLRLELALDTPLNIGLDGPEAVHLWTKGRYTARSQPKSIHVAVAADDEAVYRKHLEDMGLPIGEGHRKPHVILRVVPEPCFTQINGTPVLDRDAVLKIIHDNPIAYDGAEQWLATT